MAKIRVDADRLGTLQDRFCARILRRIVAIPECAMIDAISLPDFETDFLAAVEATAAAEAAGVAYLLALWDIKSPSKSGELAPTRFNQEFYLALSVGLRFTMWEADQTRFHLEAGLPSGKDVLLSALRLVAGDELEELATRLHNTSLRLLHDHFVWVAKTEQAVDLTFHGPLTDEQLDVIADFLWDNRNALNS